MNSNQCPLCKGGEIAHYFQDCYGNYHHCGACDLIFKSDEDLLSSDEERSRYESHNNDIKDQGYYNFLSQLVEPMLAHLKEDARGVDYGSGPEISIEKIFEDHKKECVSYDPFFCKNEEHLKKDHYDFLTCSEAVEHMFHPGDELKLMLTLVKEGGVIGIMTQPHPQNKAQFESWWYKKDPTHVRFFSQKTFDWISEFHNLRPLYQEGSVFVFKKVDA